jgi:Acetyltransferase (GNAT) domain
MVATGRSLGISSASADLGSKGRDTVASPGSAFSIYHESWWLDAVTDGHWREALVTRDGVVVGRMPYILDRKLGFRISRMNSLVRTLGPVINLEADGTAPQLSRRVDITNALIDQLPRFDWFEQLFDPRITDAVTFSQRGFAVGQTYTFLIPPGRAEDELWDGVTFKTRNHIRKAAKTLTVTPDVDLEKFCRFYGENLGAERNYHGLDRMRRAVREILARKAGTLLGAHTPDGTLTAAVCIVWDIAAARYLLATRRVDLAGSGATMLLIWEAIRLACRRAIGFDFDGIASPGMLEFLAAFGGDLTTRLRVRRGTWMFALAQAGLVSVGQRFPRSRPRPSGRPRETGQVPQTGFPYLRSSA